MVIYDAVVIGSGVAGMTAAIYLKRSNIDVLVLEKGMPGGQINNTATIDNYPGFLSITGPDLSLNMYKQIKDLDINYKYGNVLSISDGDIKTIKTDVEEIKAKTIVIAAGREPRLLGLPNEQKLAGLGISWCAICDGPLYKNKIVAVVGGGNSAMEESLYLSQICTKVYIINRSEKFRADPILVEKIKTKENIEILYNSNVTKLIEENNTLKSIEVNNQPLAIDGLFIFIGFEPITEPFKNLNLNTENGYIVVDREMQTNIKGIFACGDIISKEFYQIATAIGEGATAALSIKKYLN